MSPKRFLLIAIHSLLAAFVANGGGDHFVQKDFVIGLWNSPERGDFNKAYKQVAEANWPPCQEHHSSGTTRPVPATEDDLPQPAPLMLISL